MARVQFGRLAISAAAGIVISIVVGLQAVSALATKNAPETAIALFPFNGEAYEVAAFAAFTEATTSEADLSDAAAGASRLSLNALKRDPASAKSHALLALAQDDPDRRAAILDLASQMNRRDLTLQGLVLEMNLSNRDVDASIAKLDEILRVHPTYHRDFFPVLGEAFKDERTVPTFSRILDGSSPWHEYFFAAHAIHQPELLPNLAKLRLQRELVDQKFDRQLIAGLVKAGEVEVAAQVFGELADTGRSGALTGQLDWSADFPPFDWQFTDDGDFRAQASRDGERLELFARPGQGGIIAQRILPVPTAPFQISVTQTSETGSSADTVRVELRCPGAEEPFSTQNLASGANTFTIERAPVCDQMQLGINARAFTGQQTLRTELSRIDISGS